MENYSWISETHPLFYEIGTWFRECIPLKNSSIQFGFGSFRIISRIYISTLYRKMASPNGWKKYLNRTVLRVVEICVIMRKIETIQCLIHGNRLECLRRTSSLSNEFNGFRLFLISKRIHSEPLRMVLNGGAALRSASRACFGTPTRFARTLRLASGIFTRRACLRYGDTPKARRSQVWNVKCEVWNVKCEVWNVKWKGVISLFTFPGRCEASPLGRRGTLQGSGVLNSCRISLQNR